MDMLHLCSELTCTDAEVGGGEMSIEGDGDAEFV